MTEQQQPSAATIAKIRTASAAPIEVRHSDAAEQWATSPERAVVFSVVNANPRAGQPVEGATKPEDWDDAANGEWVAPVEPDTIQVDYTMPAKPNAGLSLIYLRRARENQDLAMSWLLELALGAEGYDAFANELAGYDDPEEAQLVMNSVMARIQRIAMGGLEGKVSASK